MAAEPHDFLLSCLAPEILGGGDSQYYHRLIHIPKSAVFPEQPFAVFSDL